MKLNKGEAIVRANAKIGRTADRLRERARLRRGAGVPAGLLTAGSGLSGSGAEGGGRKRVHHADRVDDRNRLQHLPRRRSVLAARCRVHGFEAHEPAMRRLPYRHRDLGQAA